MDEEQTVHVSKKPESEEDVYEKTIKEATLKRNQIDYLLMKVYYNGVLEGAFVRIQELQFKKYVLAQVLGIECDILVQLLSRETSRTSWVRR
jgi:hypothetical protein